jgi:hypothetical protein
MKTIPTPVGSSLYRNAEQQPESNFFYELIDHFSGAYGNHHYPGNDFPPPAFEDEYDNYNSDFDLDTK